MKSHVLNIILIWTLSITGAVAQCPNDNSFLGDLTPSSCPGTATNTCVQGGQYVSVNVVSGNSYTFSTCGDTDFDTQLTLYNGTTSVGFDDDGCGLQSTITWTATYTGTLNVLVDEYYCWDNTGCMTLEVSCSSSGSGCSGGPVCTGSAADVCATACSLGTLNSPNACPDGTGTTQTWCGSNIGATAANPYQYQLSCTGGGDMPTLVPDVWYTFTPQGNSVIIDVNGLNNPSIGLWDGDCAGLGGIGCANGTGSASLVVEPVIPGNTYYLQVSGGDPTDIDDFELTITNSFNCDICLTEASISVDPPPTNGFYESDTEVTFCYTIDTWIQQNSNWLHGVQVSFGAGWDQSTLSTVPAATQDGWGIWSWYNTPVTSSIPSNGTFPPGFYYESLLDADFNNTITNPGDNYGDNGTGGWEFCWTISTRDCPPAIDGTDLGITVTTTADGESGDWPSVACTPDPSVIANAILTCCPEPILQNVINNPCNGDCAGSATVIGDGTGPYSYTWVNDGNGLTVHSDNSIVGASTANGLCSGTYTVEVTDHDNGCIANLQVEINEPTPVLGSLDATTDADCFGTATGTATVSASGGTAPYTYDIGSGPVTSGTFSGLAAGAYTVTIQDDNGCIDIVNINITEPTPVIGALDATTDADCNGATTGSATLSASGGTPPYTFDIGSGPQASGDFNNLAAGAYSVTVQDDNGCTDIVNININEPTPVAGTIQSQTDPTCFNGTDGEFVITASGGTPSYDYDEGSGNQATGTFIGYPAGTYSVDVTDANGCMNTVSITLNEPIEVVGLIDNQTDASCSGMADATVDISAIYGTAPYTFDMGNGPQNSGLFTSLTAGTFNVIIEDLAGCQDTIPVTLLEPVSLTASIVNQTEVSCFEGADGWVEISAQDGTGPYSFDIGNGSQPSGIFSGLTAGNYSVTVADANDCSVQVEVDIIEPTELIASIVSQTNLTCFASSDGQFEVAASGGMPDYNYDIGTGTQPTGVFENLLPNTFAATIMDANGCQTTIDVTISEPAPLMVDAGNDLSICDGDVIQLSATGAISYSWAPIQDLSEQNIANPDFNGSNTTTLTVTGTDADGCVATDDITVTVNLLPVIDAGADEVICTGLTVQLNASGAVSYVWNAATNLDDANNQSPTFSGTVTETLTVLGTDGNGCVNTDDVTIIVNNLPIVDAGSDQVICEGSSVQLQSSGGTSYTWGPQNGLNNYAISNPVFSGLNTTTYTVTSIDGNGCADSDEITITVNAILPVDAGIDTAICIGETVQLFASGASTYVWSPANGLDDSNISNPVYSGTITTGFTVVGTDANGCNASDDITVTINPLPIIDAGLDEAICIGDQAQLSVTGASTYDWSPSTDLDDHQIATPIFSGTSNTLFTVIGTDANGCSNSGGVNVTVNALPVVDAGSDVEICSSFSTQLTAVGATSYEWNPATDLDNANVFNPTFSGLNTTVFTVTGTDGNGCENTDDVTITVNQLPAVDAGANHSICEEDSAQLEVIGTGSVIWFPGNSLSNPTIFDPVATPTSTQEYVVQLTDAAGCLNTDTVVVTVMLNPTAVIVANSEACETEPIDFMSASIGNIVTTTWIFGDGNSESQTSFVHDYATAGTYQVILAVTTDEGCSNIATQDMDIHPNPTAQFSVDNACLIEDVNFSDESTIPSGSIVLWNWEFGDSNSSASQNPSHNYATEGTYTVELQIETDFGCPDSITNYVTIHPMPVADFSFTNACADAIATLTDNSSIAGGTINQWQWVLNSSDTILSQFPSLGILPVGVYSVELTVWSNEGCSNSITQEFEIYPLPIADFSATTVCQGLETVFTDLSTGTPAYPITDWNWMIDGTQPSSEPDTTYIYPTYGHNLAMLEVTNSAGCSSQISQNDILVHPAPIADFSFTSHFCEHDSVFFTDQSFVSVFTNDELISWNWTFDTTGSASGQLSDYIYEEFGAHEVILEVVTNNGCVGMDTQIVDINPLPEVVIDANIFEGCQPLPVQFTSLSTIEEGYHITGWEWTFGDGTGPVYDQHPGHDFMGSEPGDTSSITYDISLTVTSADGCVATVTEEEFILVHANPTALFEVNHLVSDLDDPKFIFTDLSSENVVDWDWDFGDGDFSYDQNPQHIYQDTGTYPVMLIVTTINGCMAVIRTSVRVNPVFTFYIPNSFTPNGDGINDYFFGQGEGYNEYNMMVYNRWGEEIFKSNNDEYHWDGSFKGQQVEQSVYVYKFVIYDWQGLLHIFTDGVTLHR